VSDTFPTPVEIVEVIRRSEHGMTEPFLCRGDNEKFYFVKGIGAGRESQIKEWVAGNLAKHFGIPVAPFTIVNVPEEILELLSPKFAYDLGAGPAFGSEERRVMELSYSQVPEVPVDVRKAVLCFDWWISNGDRTLTERGGNPNLFWEPGTRDLIVIDHNQAFDDDFCPDDFFKYHAFKGVSSGIADDLVERELYTSKMKAALEQWTMIEEGLPEEWLYKDKEMTLRVDVTLDLLRDHLQRFEGSAFWNWK